jgi:hypothetical protein
MLKFTQKLIKDTKLSISNGLNGANKQIVATFKDFPMPPKEKGF